MTQTAASHWSEQEIWVWEQIAKGERANFNKHEKGGGELDPKVFDKDGATVWPDFHKLTNKFLNDILFGKDDKDKPYINSIPRTGVQISGAWFDEEVDLSSGIIERRLAMLKTRFNGHANFGYVIAKDFISLNGSRFAGEVSFNAINIRTNLLINDALLNEEVNMKGAQIGGQISMRGSNFKQRLAMDEIKVFGALFMDTDENGGKAVFEGDVRLQGAQIGGQVSMKGSNFKQPLWMDGMKVGGSLFMDRDATGGALFDGVVLLNGAQIGAQIVMNDSTFNQGLFMEVAQASDLSFTNITIVKGANFYCLTVTNNLALGPFTSDIGGKINLSHAKAGVLRSEENSWPAEPGQVDLPKFTVDLTGFTYERIIDKTKNNIGEIGWFDRMLESQGHFTPQPYEQLAKVLMAEGYRERAEEILYDKRVLERENLKLNEISSWPRWFLFLLLEGGIGYGYKNYLLIGWVILFVTLGIGIIYCSGERAANGIGWMIFYSLNMLLPIGKLGKEFTDVVWCHSLPKYYFYLQQFIGYVLAIFAAAGLSGLAKKQGS
jgi:hypothetical protein